MKQKKIASLKDKYSSTESEASSYPTYNLHFDSYPCGLYFSFHTLLPVVGVRNIIVLPLVTHKLFANEYAIFPIASFEFWSQPVNSDFSFSGLLVNRSFNPEIPALLATKKVDESNGVGSCISYSIIPTTL